MRSAIQLNKDVENQVKNDLANYGRQVTSDLETMSQERWRQQQWQQHGQQHKQQQQQRYGSSISRSGDNVSPSGGDDG